MMWKKGISVNKRDEWEWKKCVWMKEVSVSEEDVEMKKMGVDEVDDFKWRKWEWLKEMSMNERDGYKKIYTEREKNWELYIFHL